MRSFGESLNVVLMLWITRKDVVELLHVSGPQAYRLLKKLEDEGSLRCEGTTRNAQYHIV